MKLGLYAAFHWVLLGLLTLPLLIAPVLLWPIFSRRFPSIDRSGFALVASLALMSTTVIAIRAAVIDHLAMLKNPALRLEWPYYFNEVTALWLGLAIPRFLIPWLRLGSFTSTRGAV